MIDLKKRVVVWIFVNLQSFPLLELHFHVLRYLTIPSFGVDRAPFVLSCTLSSWNVSLTIVGQNVTMHCIFLLALLHSCHLPREHTRSRHWPMKNNEKTCGGDLNLNPNLGPSWAGLQVTAELRMRKKQILVAISHWVLGCFLRRHYCNIGWHTVGRHSSIFHSKDLLIVHMFMFKSLA